MKSTRQHSGSALTIRRSRIRALMAALLAINLVDVSSALVRSALAASDDDPARRFEIPAGPLDPALDRFSREAGLRIAREPGATVRRRTAGVSGRLRLTEALARLLEGTGLSFRFSTDGRAMIGGKTAAAAPPERVVVIGSGGYVAHESSAGTKTATPIIDTPQSVSVITHAQLQEQNLPTVAQALQYGSGVSTGTRGGYDPRFDYATIRGFNESIEGDYRDGLRQNLGVGSYFSYFGTEPYGLDRIDVVRGPTAVTYGQNAPGGIIDKISKVPTETPLREVEAELGSNNWYEGALDISGPAEPSDAVLYRLTGIARDADAPFPREKDNRIYVAPALTIHFDDRTTLLLLTNYEKDQTGVGTVARAADGDLTQVYLDDPSFSHFDRQQGQIGYQLEHRFSDALVARQNFRYGLVDTNYSALNQSSASGTTVDRYAENVQEGLDTYAVDNQVEGRYGTGPVKHTVLLGFDYFRSTLNSGILYQPNAPPLNLLDPVYDLAIPPFTQVLTSNRQVIDQYGLYLQDQARWRNLILVLSGRQDWADSTLDNRLTSQTTAVWNTAQTGRAAVLYASSIGLSPYASLSNTFVPNIGIDRTGQLFSPTTGLQEEVGLKYQSPGGRSLTTLSLYNINEHNVLVSDPVNPTFQTETGEIRSRGVEVETRAEIDRNTAVIANYSYDDVRNVRSSPANTVGKIPIADPTDIGSLWLSRTQPINGVSLLEFGGGIRYTGPTYADAANTVHNPAQGYLDLEAHYDFFSWRIQLNATNVTDRRVASCYGTVCTENENRFVLATVRYRF